MRLGGRSATPCEARVRRKSTGSPPAPRSSISVARGAIALFNAPVTAYIRAVAILGVDVGGTFTDAVLVEGGRVSTAKVPTAARQEQSVLAAARAVGAERLERFTHGTTVAPNGALERKGARTAVVATTGVGRL